MYANEIIATVCDSYLGNYQPVLSTFYRLLFIVSIILLLSTLYCIVCSSACRWDFITLCGYYVYFVTKF